MLDSILVIISAVVLVMGACALYRFTVVGPIVRAAWREACAMTANWWFKTKPALRDLLGPVWRWIAGAFDELAPVLQTATGRNAAALFIVSLLPVLGPILNLSTTLTAQERGEVWAGVVSAAAGVWFFLRTLAGRAKHPIERHEPRTWTPGGDNPAPAVDMELRPDFVEFAKGLDVGGTVSVQDVQDMHDAEKAQSEPQKATKKTSRRKAAAKGVRIADTKAASVKKGKRK